VVVEMLYSAYCKMLETAGNAGFEHNAQRITDHRDGKADVPRDPQTCTQEAGDRVCAVTQADTSDGDRHPDVLRCRHAAQQIPSHVGVQAGAGAGKDDGQGSVLCLLQLL